ncbi:MAG: MBL fold metallo-hydrolase [Patescibacteria group bacterium]|nr:MBL fold metallo-hydrolase [Patescibacteria group bacterium]
MTKKIIFTIITIFILGFYYFYEKNDKLLNIVFIDVGQGDAILIKSQNGKNILIDGGPDSDLAEKMSKFMAYRNNKIDLIIISHPHRDHYYGLISVIKKYKTQKIIYSGIDVNLQDYNYMKKIIDEYNLVFIKPKLADKYEIDEGLYLSIIYMPKTKTVDNLNDASVSIKLTYKNFDVIFNGDASCEIENIILRDNSNLKSEIFKASHHASKYSNCDNLLNSIKPRITVIQSGADNKFGHPHQEAMDRIIKSGSKILRNDELGDIIIKSDGDNYQIYSSK